MEGLLDRQAAGLERWPVSSAPRPEPGTIRQ